MVMSSANVSLSTPQWQNKAFKITGTLAANLTLFLPLSTNAIAGTPAVGGEFIVWNATTGGFSISVSTLASGAGAGVTVPQGARAALYSDTVNVWYANDAFGIPAGTGADWYGTTAPPGWLLCFGQSLLRAQYPALFNAISTAYGSIDGTHFTLPDCRGRSNVGKDDMGGSAANRITSGGSGVPGTVLGGVGGNELMQLHSHGVTDPTHTHGYTGPLGGSIASVQGGPNPIGNAAAGGTTAAAATGISIQNAGAGGSQNMPPVIVNNKIIFSGA